LKIVGKGGNKGGDNARGNFMPERIKLRKYTKGLRGHVKRIVWLGWGTERNGKDYSVNSLTDKCLELAFTVNGVN